MESAHSCASRESSECSCFMICKKKSACFIQYNIFFCTVLIWKRRQTFTFCSKSLIALVQDSLSCSYLLARSLSFVACSSRVLSTENLTKLDHRILSDTNYHKFTNVTTILTNSYLGSMSGMSYCQGPS